MKKFFPEFETDFKKLLEEVRGAKIAVVGHLRPDGDCISSQFALSEILNDAGAKEVVCLNKNALPRLYENFADKTQFIDAEKFERDDFELVTVDCADFARTSPALVEKFPVPLACIDHHFTNAAYAKINIIDPKAAATAEIIAGLADDAHLPISRENATRLYMGIAMDTRQFTTSSTRAKTFEISAMLSERGADTAWVAVQLFQRESFAKIKLTQRYLESLRICCQNRACIGFVKMKDFVETGAERPDTDGLVDIARSIDGVEIAAVLEETANGVKGSLRGKTNEFEVNKIAAFYGGGGHLAAAGFTVEGANIESFLPEFTAVVQKRLDEMHAEYAK